MIDETIVRELFDKWPDTTGATISIPADYEYWRAVQWYAWRSAFDVAYRMGAERAEQEAASLRAENDILIGALADIGNNTDMTRAQMQHKAKRICAELAAAERKA
jgi:hypothetical protein